MQWGSLPFHQQSLRNLAKAMLRTRQLCAVMIDTLGREVYVRREFKLGDDHWPKHGSAVAVATGDKITLAMDPNAKQTDTVFPINYSKLSGA
jgi:pyruvate kinase